MFALIAKSTLDDLFPGSLTVQADNSHGPLSIIALYQLSFIDI